MLPALSPYSGHSAKFLIGDILAIAILKRLTDICSIKIGNLSGISEALFDLCKKVPLDQLENLILQVDLKNDTCKTTPFADQLFSADVLIVIPLSVVVSELRADILEMQKENAQGQLTFSMPASNDSLPANISGST